MGTKWAIKHDDVQCGMGKNKKRILTGKITHKSDTFSKTTTVMLERNVSHTLEQANTSPIS